MITNWEKFNESSLFDYKYKEEGVIYAVYASDFNIKWGGLRWRTRGSYSYGDSEFYLILPNELSVTIRNISRVSNNKSDEHLLHIFGVNREIIEKFLENLENIYQIMDEKDMLRLYRKNEN